MLCQLRLYITKPVCVKGIHVCISLKILCGFLFLIAVLFQLISYQPKWFKESMLTLFFFVLYSFLSYMDIEGCLSPRLIHVLLFMWCYHLWVMVLVQSSLIYYTLSRLSFYYLKYCNTDRLWLCSFKKKVRSLSN